MRLIPFLASAAVATGLVVVFNTKLALPAPLGAILSPQQGIWQNAEPATEDFGGSFNFPQLKGKVQVYLDDRLVPHIFAEQENDAYFVQGYLHARFRLWQMELQSHAAAGRLAEIVGDKALNRDREFRRMGMTFAAERAVVEMEKDPIIKGECDAYTAGINAYIATLTSASLPIEYKLIGYEPEQWSNLKTALFLKYMSFDLAGGESDFEMTNAKSFFSPADFDKLFPAMQDSLDPIIPTGTALAVKPAMIPQKPASADSLYFSPNPPVALSATRPHPENGSNNWAVSGKKTKSGAPILCNDPHLGLNLPSLWFEIQISTPKYNSYGVSFPGAPGVVIGFNDSCAFGFTNGGRDVKDYYEIKFKDDSKQEYWFNGGWKKADLRVETIKVAGKADVLDTVAYTIFGPVMYDKGFSGGRQTNNRYYALRWTAHDPSNELRIFHDLNLAKNYNDYLAATQYLHTPGQNCLFATKSGDVAIRTQGDFPAKWVGQGDFIMPGTDSSYMWQGMIPQSEVPFQYNPERGFVSSANQRPVDYSYPYYLGRDYPLSRGRIVNRMLAGMSNITAEDMMKMQTDNYNIFAEMARPVLLKNINTAGLSAVEKKYFDLLQNWNLRNDVGSKGTTIFIEAWKKLEEAVFADEYAKAPKSAEWPLNTTLMEQLLKDSAYSFVDDVKTPQKETLAMQATQAFKKAVVVLQELEGKGLLDWEKAKATRIGHLGRIDPFSRLNLPIGGGQHIINATTETHGPSWRMVVHLTPQTEAYGIYPGGQSGNPGSKYYDNFVDDWVAGRYNKIWVMTRGQEKDTRIKWTMQFDKN